MISNAAIAGVVGDRVAYGRAPQSFVTPYAVLWLLGIESQNVVSGVQVFKRSYQVEFVVQDYVDAITIEDALLNQVDSTQTVDGDVTWEWKVEAMSEVVVPQGDGDESGLMLVQATIGAWPL